MGRQYNSGGDYDFGKAVLLAQCSSTRNRWHSIAEDLEVMLCETVEWGVRKQNKIRLWHLGVGLSVPTRFNSVKVHLHVLGLLLDRLGLGRRVDFQIRIGRGP